MWWKLVNYWTLRLFISSYWFYCILFAFSELTADNSWHHFVRPMLNWIVVADLLQCMLLCNWILFDILVSIIHDNCSLCLNITNISSFGVVIHSVLAKYRICGKKSRFVKCRICTDLFQLVGLVSRATYLRPSLTSACLLVSIYVLCSVYGSKAEFTLYVLFTELYMARVWRCRITYDQHSKIN